MIAFVKPSTGFAGVATPVVITGVGFAGGGTNLVYFATSAATGVKLVSDNELDVTTPATIPLGGAVDLSVVNSKGVGKLASAFTGTPLPPVYQDLEDAAAVTGPDGRIYLFGGAIASAPGAVASVEAYSVTTPSWDTSPTSMPQPLYAMGAVLGPDNRIYLFGGLGASAVASSATFAYSTTTHLWDTSLPSNPSFAGPTLAAIGADGQAYVICNSNRCSTPGAMVAYAFAARIWDTKVSALPAGRYGAAAAEGSDRLLYLLGGSPASGTGCDQAVLSFSTMANRWSKAPSLLDGRYEFPAISGADGRLYAIGGGLGSLLGSVEAFAPASGAWVTVAPLNLGRSNGAAALGPDGRIYLFGGQTPCGLSNAVEDYSPSANAWY